MFNIMKLYSIPSSCYHYFRHPREAFLRGESAKEHLSLSVIPAKAGTQTLSQRMLGTSIKKTPRRGQLLLSSSSGQARGQVLGPSLRWDDAGVERPTHYATMSSRGSIDDGGGGMSNSGELYSKTLLSVLKCCY